MIYPIRPSTDRRRATARRLLARADDDAEARAALDALPADPCGAVLAERLRFGPPETWLGWRAGLGRVAVKLWPAGVTVAPMPPLSHPGVAPLLAQGPCWRMFAWIAGRTLAVALRERSVPPETAGQIAAALAALHAAGQPHGDLKPANVVIGARGAVLIDWGEASAGTPGWRPDGPHDATARDAYALRRLDALISAPPAGRTPAGGRRSPTDRE